MMSMFQIVVGCLFMTFFLYIVIAWEGCWGGGGGVGVRYIMTLSIMFGISWVLVLTQVTPDYN